MLATYIRHNWVCSILITLSGDTEKNPGPKPSSCDKFSICHWNLNDISEHNVIKRSLLRAYIQLIFCVHVCMYVCGQVGGQTFNTYRCASTSK